jgi:hypothetical protein
LNNKTRKSTGRKLYKFWAVPIVTYIRSRNLVNNKRKQEAKIESAEIKFLRRKGQIRNAKLGEELNICNIIITGKTSLFESQSSLEEKIKF